MSVSLRTKDHLVDTLPKTFALTNGRKDDKFIILCSKVINEICSNIKLKKQALIYTITRHLGERKEESLPSCPFT